MWRLADWMYFLLLALSLTTVQKVMACMCFPQHPQTHFCQADFVALMRVKKVLPATEYEVGYKVKINRIFKSNAEADAALQQNVLWTPSQESYCGMNLNVGETYVIAGRVFGGKARISLCGLTLKWSEVTSIQRKSFKRFYLYGCVCEISYTQWWRKGAVLESAGGKRCLWESAPGPQDCQEKYGVCMVVPGGCSWIPSVPYKNCIKEYQRQREQQRAREP